VGVRATPDQGGRELASLVWGLLPSWSKEPSVGFINARAESAASKPAFRTAFRRRRCLVPADGFFEWKRAGK
jgi:putative SOS response-associated peptidase YedK